MADASEYFPEAGDLSEEDVDCLLAEFGLGIGGYGNSEPGFLFAVAPQALLDL